MKETLLLIFLPTLQLLYMGDCNQQELLCNSAEADLRKYSSHLRHKRPQPYFFTSCKGKKPPPLGISKVLLYRDGKK